SFGEDVEREVERPEPGRAGVGLVVAAKEADVVRPGATSGVVGLRLEHDQRRIALAGGDDDVVPLHAPVVREVDDVVRRPNDERVQVLLGHERADAVQLGVVPGPGHGVTLSARKSRRRVDRRKPAWFHDVAVAKTREMLWAWCPGGVPETLAGEATVL